MAAHTKTGTMASPNLYESKQPEHLGLAAGMFDELGIGELLDKLIPQDGEKRILTIGQAVKAMVLNGSGFANRALYLTPLFFRDKTVERLIGEGVEPDSICDDVPGRALDAIYAYNPDRLYPQSAMEAAKRPGLLCRFGHLDSAGFHVDGQYNSDGEPEAGVIHIAKGYSRDRRPDLNQVVLQSVSERQAGIPLLMQTQSGKNSDKNSFREMVCDFAEQMRGGSGIEYPIADSALYVAETLKSMSDLLWISRVPETLALACDVIDVVAPALMRDPTHTAFRRLEAEYGEVRLRRAVVFSPQACLRAEKTVNKQCRKQSTTESKAFAKLCKQDFACEADARKALTAFGKNLKMTCVNDAIVSARPRFEAQGRPAASRLPDFYVCRIEGAIASLLPERVRRPERKSCFILAGCQLNCEVLSDEALIAAYKDRQKAERGFRFLKDPMFMASTLFLKSPERIMALMMVMTLCLMVYAALEHRIRETLAAHGETFPNRKGKLIGNPAARRVFRFFVGIQVLIIDGTRELVLNLNEYQVNLLKLPGERYEILYSGNG